MNSLQRPFVSSFSRIAGSSQLFPPSFLNLRTKIVPCCRQWHIQETICYRGWCDRRPESATKVWWRGSSFCTGRILPLLLEEQGYPLAGKERWYPEIYEVGKPRNHSTSFTAMYIRPQQVISASCFCFSSLSFVLRCCARSLRQSSGLIDGD